jgi:hypothetical protein
MREFQRAAMNAIGSLLEEWGVHPEWIEICVGPLPAMAYGADDVDLYARFGIDGSQGEVWIHPDDLSVKLFGESRIVESQDFPGDPDAQIRKFCESMQEVLDGYRAGMP